MLFADYLFDVFDDGTIIMDEELKPEQLHLKHGDKYVVKVTHDGRIVFQKIEDGQHSRSN